MSLRIDPQNPPAETATRALGAPRPDDTRGVAVPIGTGRGELVAGYDALIAMLGASLDGAQGGADGRTGPIGIADAAARELNDPLGLATRQAAVTPSESPLTNAPIKTPSHGGEHAAPDQSAGRPIAQFNRSALHEQTPAPRGTDASPGRPGGANAEAAASTPRTPSAVAPVSADAGPASPAQPGSAVRTVSAVAPSGGGAGNGATGQGPQNGTPGNLPGVASTGGVPRGAERPEGLSFAKQAQHLRSQHAELAPQVAKGLAALVLRDGGRAQIQLRPEALGRVEVDLSIRDGVVNATMSAENETARDLLSSELDRLRVLLEQRGLRVESLEIVSDPAEPEARGGADDNRGSRWMSAQDESRGDGRDAGTGSPWSGGQDHRARDGGPMPRAERGRPTQDAGTTEIGAASDTGDLGAIGGRSPPGLWVRLDTVA